MLICVISNSCIPYTQYNDNINDNVNTNEYCMQLVYAILIRFMLILIHVYIYIYIYILLNRSRPRSISDCTPSGSALLERDG